MLEHLLDNLDVFYGELTPARATVYARLEGMENTTGLSLSGVVCGPRCFYSKTLPATFRLHDAGPGPSLLAKSLVPDPSYWSPETPHIYDVTVELRKGTEIIASEVRQIGFKPLGISGRFFTWEGKPWVLRGVSTRLGCFDAAHWHDRTTCAVFAGWQDDETLLRSLEGLSSYGVLTWIFVVAEIKHSILRHWVSQLSRFPCVAGLVLLAKESSEVFTPDIFAAAPNLLIGCAGKGVTPTDSRGKFFWIRPDYGRSLNDFSTSDRPIVVVQELKPAMASWSREPFRLEQARAACDKLQADLAPYGQFAGYIV
jgi:Glycosyl hydrolases family 2